ncbi:helix-turn-helix transcriptional regulator [Haloprofundus halobius]|uniref:helix-turn-helix transcriptional regulator n=1 Tax=Haloprofundus halobius TaxID=2876194 RepID=UPI001CCDAD7E|nr:helix-turn-helix domain-containing protein [Haloprofundus halobius]
MPVATAANASALSASEPTTLPQTAPPSDNSSLGEIRFSEEGTVRWDGEQLYVWRNESSTLSTRFHNTGERSLYEFCAYAEDDDGKQVELDCQQMNVDPNGSRKVVFEFQRYPPNVSGERNVTVVATRGFGDEEAVSTTTTSRIFVEKSGDYDGDGLSNEREAELETDMNSQDTDGDGLSDRREVTKYQSSPLSSDTDDDGLRDQQEVYLGTNVTDPDTDGDGLSDGAEVDEHGTDPLVPDSDGDGLTDSEELALDTDPTEEDTDGDGLHDGAEVNGHNTDPLAADTDDDGINDSAEVGLYGTNPLRADSDGDGFSDRAELRLGTNPTNPATTVGFAGLALAVLAGVGVWYRRSDHSVATAVRRRGSDLVAAVRSPSDSEQRVVEADPGADDPSAAPPFDSQIPLSDDGRVLRMLHEESGRLRQSEIVERTDWSKSKVSRLLSRMEEEGKLTKINVGRENVIALTDETPDWADSALR